MQLATAPEDRTLQIQYKFPLNRDNGDVNKGAMGAKNTLWENILRDTYNKKMYIIS
jgi:hypothetical protein